LTTEGKIEFGYLSFDYHKVMIAAFSTYHSSFYLDAFPAEKQVKNERMKKNKKNKKMKEFERKQTIYLFIIVIHSFLFCFLLVFVFFFFTRISDVI